MEKQDPFGLNNSRNENRDSVLDEFSALHTGYVSLINIINQNSKEQLATSESKHSLTAQELKRLAETKTLFRHWFAVLDIDDNRSSKNAPLWNSRGKDLCFRRIAELSIMAQSVIATNGAAGKDDVLASAFKLLAEIKISQPETMPSREGNRYKAVDASLANSMRAVRELLALQAALKANIHALHDTLPADVQNSKAVSKAVKIFIALSDKSAMSIPHGEYTPTQFETLFSRIAELENVRSILQQATAPVLQKTTLPEKEKLARAKVRRNGIGRVAAALGMAVVGLSAPDGTPRESEYVPAHISGQIQPTSIKAQTQRITPVVPNAPIVTRANTGTQSLLSPAKMISQQEKEQVAEFFKIPANESSGVLSALEQAFRKVGVAPKTPLERVLMSAAGKPFISIHSSNSSGRKLLAAITNARIKDVDRVPNKNLRGKSTVYDFRVLFGPPARIAAMQKTISKSSSPDNIKKQAQTLLQSMHVALQGKK